MIIWVIAVLLLLLCSPAIIGATFCPIKDDTTIVYSTVNGVGPASLIWVQDFLWWWASYDSTIKYLPLAADDLKNCELVSYPNLRVYINPGGDAYKQLAAMGSVGAQHIKDFVLRDQSAQPSAYVGFCAGGYIASHDYLWETMYEGTDYYMFSENPPLSLFPHTIEGSIVDINDDQFADQHGSKFRAVNVSNGHIMLYYGGSTFGWNGSPDYANKDSPNYDPALEVLIYYTDFYGFHSANIPAAWRYNPHSQFAQSHENKRHANTLYDGNNNPNDIKNVLLTSVHPEADNCTTSQDSDCPPANSLSTEDILRNRAWLTQYINEAAQTNFTVPVVSIAPVFNTTAPHDSTPTATCYHHVTDSDSIMLLFCDGFDTQTDSSKSPAIVPYGLSVQFQRNQTDYNHARPWNTTYINTWNDGTYYASPYHGDGYAVVVPRATSDYTASISSKAFDVAQCPEDRQVHVEYAYTGRGLPGSNLSVDYSMDAQTWHSIAVHDVSDAVHTPDENWSVVSNTVYLPDDRSGGYAGRSQMIVRFTCRVEGNEDDVKSFCALDSLSCFCQSLQNQLK